MRETKTVKYKSMIVYRTTIDTIQDMKYEVQEMMIVDNVEDAIVDEWVSITNKMMEKYQELVDRLKGCLEDLRERKNPEIRKKEDAMQEERFK